MNARRAKRRCNRRHHTFEIAIREGVGADNNALANANIDDVTLFHLGTDSEAGQISKQNQCGLRIGLSQLAGLRPNV